MINRRVALGRLVLILGGTAFGANVLTTGCRNRKSELPQSQIAMLLDEVGETILPASPASPGAKETGIGKFMQTIVADCYTENDQKIFYEGIEKLNKACLAKYESTFLDSSSKQRHTLLTEIDKEVAGYNQSRREGDPEHYFSMMKQLTIWGYFTSEAGATKALRYVPVPGKYEGCVSYKRGDKAFAAI